MIGNRWHILPCAMTMLQDFLVLLLFFHVEADSPRTVSDFFPT